MKDVEQATVDKAKVKGDDNGLDTDVEIVSEDNTAGQLFDFPLPTQGWAKDRAKRLGLPVDLENTNLPSEPMTPASIPRNWLPQHRLTIKGEGSGFFRSLGHILWGKDSRNEDALQLQTTVRQRIQEQWTRVYGPPNEWVKDVADKGSFTITKEEWNALFNDPNGWATLSVIQLAATMLNCRFLIYTPVDPVPKEKLVAPDAAWIWKDGKPDPNHATGTVSRGHLALQSMRPALHPHLFTGDDFPTSGPPR